MTQQQSSPLTLEEQLVGALSASIQKLLQHQTPQFLKISLVTNTDKWIVAATVETSEHRSILVSPQTASLEEFTTWLSSYTPGQSLRS